MSQPLPLVYLARHGETAWTISGQHTSITDIPLTERGERQGRQFGERLRTLTFARVFTSPLQRARKTCELAGFGSVAELTDDLIEWNYGNFEGVKTVDIQKDWPGWHLFRDGCPGGESVADVDARTARVIARLRAIDGNVLLFSSGHFLRALAVQWLGLGAAAGQYLLLSPGTLSILGYEHNNLNEPVIRLWNDASHVS